MVWALVIGHILQVRSWDVKKNHSLKVTHWWSDRARGLDWTQASDPLITTLISVGPPVPVARCGHIYNCCCICFISLPSKNKAGLQLKASVHLLLLFFLFFPTKSKTTLWYFVFIIPKQAFYHIFLVYLYIRVHETIYSRISMLLIFMGMVSYNRYLSVTFFFPFFTKRACEIYLYGQMHWVLVHLTAE